MSHPTMWGQSQGRRDPRNVNPRRANDSSTATRIATDSVRPRCKFGVAVSGQGPQRGFLRLRNL